MRIKTNATYILSFVAAVLGCSSTTEPAGDATDSTEVGTGGSATGIGSGGFASGIGGGVGGAGASVDGAGGSASGGATFTTGGQGSGGGVATGGQGSGGEVASGGEQAGTGGADPVGSEGCGLSSAQEKEKWISSTVNDGTSNRGYDVWLPEGYDPARSYPLVLQLHGCGGKTNNVPLENQTGSDAILIRGAGSGADNCWDDVKDLPYIDAMLEDAQQQFCVNPDHLFATGYSSGSWVASKLSCVRGDVFRGIATVTGGEPGGVQSCVGQVGRMFIHDNTDNNNKIEWDTPSRDRMIKTNHCDAQTMSVDPSPCVAYQGCDPGYPVVWCETSGQGHSRQDNLAAPAFWNFFQSLMAD